MILFVKITFKEEAYSGAGGGYWKRKEKKTSKFWM